MKTILLSTILTLSVISAIGQDIAADSAAPSNWKITGGVSLNLNQVGLYRWQGGGLPSFSVGLIYKGSFNYAKDKKSWENYVDFAYGVIRQGSKPLTKSDDRWEFGTKYGYQVSQSWDLNVFATLRSQFTAGYDEQNPTKEISNLMAPGYLITGIGMNYKKGDWLNINLSPVTGKSTIITDSAIANIPVEGSDRGKYGNELGNPFRQEFGAFAKVTIKKEILENVILTTRADFFSDYLHNFGAVDVNWNVIALMKVNKFLAVAVTMDLLYDEDIAIVLERNNNGEPIHVGPAVQLKETIGIGFTYKY